MSSDDVFDKGDPKKHYIVLGQIGAGSYGNVYKAQDKKTQEYLALKVLTIEHPDDLDEMTNEVTIHRSLAHPNIAAFHGAWRKGKEVSIALELCECGSARDLFARVGFRPVPEAVIAPIARGLLSALQYLHDKWVLHRDVKAANVLITGSGGIKLSDFGVSCRLATRTERRRSLLGTPHWLAPEVMTSVTTFLPYDSKADIWSVGVTMVELAEGRPPLWDLDVPQVMLEVPRRPAPLLKDPSLYSLAFCDFTHSCLNKSAAARPDVAKLRSHNWIVDVKSGASDVLAYVEKTKQGAAAFPSTVATAPAVHMRPSRRALGAVTASSRGTPPIPPAASASPPPPSLSPRPASQQTQPTSASAAPVPTRPMSVQAAPFASPASPPPLSSSPPGVSAAALFALAPPGFSPTFSAPVSPRKITIPASLIAPPSLTDLAVKPVPPYSLSNSTSSSASSGPPSLANSNGAVPIPANPPRGSRSPHRTPSPSPPSQTSPLSSPKTSPRHFRNTGVFNPALPSHVHSPQRERAFSGPAPPIAGGQRALSPQREAAKGPNWKSPPRRAPAVTDAPRPDRSVSPFRAGPGLSPKRERTGTAGATGGPYIPMFGLQRLSPQRTRPAGLTAPPPLGIPIASPNPNPNPNPKTSPGAPPYSAVVQANFSTPVPPLLADLITPHPLSGSTVFQPSLNSPPSPRSNYTMMPDMVRSVVPTPMSPRSQRAVPVSTYAPSSPRSNYEYLPDVAAPAPPASSSLLLNLPTSETLANPVRKISQSSPANFSVSPATSPRPLGPTLPRGSGHRPPLPSWVALFVRCGISPDKATAYERIFIGNEMELDQMRDLNETILRRLAVAPDDAARILSTLRTLEAS